MELYLYKHFAKPWWNSCTQNWHSYAQTQLYLNTFACFVEYLSLLVLWNLWSEIIQKLQWGKKKPKTKPNPNYKLFFAFRKLTALPWPSLLLVSQQPEVALGSCSEHVSQKNGFVEWITTNIYAKCVTEASQEILFKKTFLDQTNILVWIHL